MKSAPEKEFQRAALEYLRMCGCVVWPMTSGLLKRGGRYIRTGPTGAPDIVGLVPGGRFIGVECKTRRGRLTTKQAEFLDAISAAGGIAVEARTLDDITEALR